MKIFKVINISVAILSCSLRANAVNVYQDNTTDLGSYLNFTNNEQIGDQIFLSNTTQPYTLTNFSMEYFSTNTAFSGTVSADIKFYMNDGSVFNGYKMPSTVFFDSGIFTLPTPYSQTGTNSGTIIFNSIALTTGNTVNYSGTLPTNFTFSITFIGLTNGNQAGVELFNPPTAGGNYGDYWLKSGGSWVLLTNGVDAFGSLFQATPIPEPSVFYLGAVSAVGLLGLKLRRTKFKKS